MKTIFLFWINAMLLFSQTQFEQLDRLIEDGHFSDAKQRIDYALKQPGISALDQWNLNFRAERMDRILKDFTKSEADVLAYIQKYIPEADSLQMRKWENEKSLEVKIIDGERKYFAQAARNLFRINKEAKEKMLAKDGITVDKLDSLLAIELPLVLKSAKTDRFLARPVEITYTYTLTVDKNTVPEGEMIRCWLPYPREDRARQKDVKLLSANSPDYIISPNDYPQRTLYMQKSARKDEPAVFEYSLKYTAYSEVHAVNYDKVGDYDLTKEELARFVKEEFPHIVFSETIKNLSKKIIGDETNKGKIVKLIYEWISGNIPWASAREYSTIPDIPLYCATNGHGDCGIQSLLFITLCRYNGIPAKWQSGWMFHPGSLNLHDWAEMYVNGYGWVPVDQSYGLQQSPDENVKWFFLGNTDSYHFIVNDNFGQPLFPEKTFPRSETVDFQRGEVEWKGGNLYFDKWDYHMEVKYKEL